MPLTCRARRRWGDAVDDRKVPLLTTPLMVSWLKSLNGEGVEARGIEVGLHADEGAVEAER